jgi:hypothetical protein
VLSLHAAATLLTAAATLDHLAPLARVVGCTGTALPLPNDARRALGLEDAQARIVAGGGARRALLLEWPRNTPLRERIATVASRLTARAPQLLWLVIAVERGASALTLATWVADRPRPRIAALAVDRRHVVPSDAETLCALAAGSDDDDVMTHTRWLEVLGRDALTRRFYRTLEGVVAHLAEAASVRASESERRDVALLWLSRLLFLSFLETKGWLDGDRRFLARHFEASAGQAGGAHRRFLLPLFFGTLNTPVARRAPAARALGTIPFLNGGLFARTAIERRHRTLHFPDDALARVFDDLLTRFRFTAREDDGVWSDAAVDPEMLGKAFESLMASRDRRSSGAYYTPHALVTRVTRAGLTQALAGSRVREREIESLLNGGVPEPSVASSLRERIERLAILDPACGSGAFLVHALEELTGLLVRCGDSRTPAAIRRALLTHSIFGVDVNPTAVWLCELRLWLAVVIEHDEGDPLRVPPLPNLDRHVRAGDALSGAAFTGGPIIPGGARIARLRARYARASGTRKRTLERELDRAERAHARAVLDAEIGRCAASRRALLGAWRGRDLFGARYTPSSAERLEAEVLRLRARELRAARHTLAHGGALPFSFATHFPDAAARGGFDAIIGNPPWVRLHRIPPSSRARLRATYAVFSRAPWEHGADAARAGRGFAAQIDLAALFVERSLELLRDGAALAMLLPTKLWRSLAGGGVRRLIAERSTVIALEDWSEYPRTFDASAYPSLLVARRGASAPEPVTLALRRRERTLQWTLPRTLLGFDHDDAAPWLLLPPPVRAAFDRVRAAGTPLHETHHGRPVLGVKCGCNEAFLVCGVDAPVEHTLLRRALRGEEVQRWRIGECPEWIIWTHGTDGRPLPVLPPRARRWLERWRPRLASRADARGSCWWSLFRTAAADSRGTRLVWADIGKAPHAAVIPAGDPTVPLNSCYVINCAHESDALALAAVLNSPVAAAWLNALAEPARGGYRRYLGWTVALLPIPRDWPRARDLLAPIAARAATGVAPEDEELLRAVARAYRLRLADLEPLLAWTGR